MRNLFLAIFGTPYTDTYMIEVNGKKVVRFTFGWIYNGKFYAKEEDV